MIKQTIEYKRSMKVLRKNMSVKKHEIFKLKNKNA